MGGGSGFLKGSLSASVRYSAGNSQGADDAESIINSLAHDKSGNTTESIKLITHSMGGAYAKGFAQALINYAKKNNIQGLNFAFEADFGTLDPKDQIAMKGILTLQFKNGKNGKDGVASQPLIGSPDGNEQVQMLLLEIQTGG